MKIGLLIPRSILYPALTFEMLDGLKAALRINGNSDTEIITESIELGTKDELIYTKAEQLILGGAQVVAAYINPKSAEFIHPLFENSGTLLLALDSGYHYPASLKKLTNAYYISLQGALCCKIASRMALEDGAKNFAYACSLFDAGYRSGHAFANTIEKGGGQLVYNHVTALSKKDFDLKPLLEQLQDGRADTVVASFCGDMTDDFLREAKNLDLFSSGKVYGAAFMAEEFWLSKMDYPGTDWTTAVPWSLKLENRENTAFVTEMEEIKPGRATVFSLLAWEAGLIVSEILKSGVAMHKSIPLLEELTLQTPRGILHANAENHYFEAAVYKGTVAENKLTGKCQLVDLAESPYTEEERSSFYADIETLTSETTSWLNVYACIDS